MATIKHAAANELQRRTNGTQPARRNRKKSAKDNSGEATHVFFGLPLRELEKLTPPKSFRLTVVVRPKLAGVYRGRRKTKDSDFILFNRGEVEFWTILRTWLRVFRLLGIQAHWMFQDDEGNNLRGMIRKRQAAKLGLSDGI